MSSTTFLWERLRRAGMRDVLTVEPATGGLAAFAGIATRRDAPPVFVKAFADAPADDVFDAEAEGLAALRELGGMAHRPAIPDAQRARDGRRRPRGLDDLTRPATFPAPQTAGNTRSTLSAAEGTHDSTTGSCWRSGRRLRPHWTILERREMLVTVLSVGSGILAAALTPWITQVRDRRRARAAGFDALHRARWA